ncbi:MAG: 16S rRNA (uracil(1498)-N(3))-methyltransferase [Mobilicoccus sp.]|nr:16S rRNA (uracil(1498)-N(3))-methyltransferase [Mobilicoccus sp.]
MTAPLFHVPTGRLAGCGVGDVVTLAGAEAHHATVKRVGVGEEVLLADGSWLLASGSVEATGADEVRVLVREVRDTRPPGPRFVLAQALAKGGRDEQAVESATELGVDEVIAWQADRSIVRWKGERSAKSLAKWANLAVAAAKQSRRASIPVVSGPVDSAGLAQRVAECTTFVLHEEATEPLAGVDLPEDGEVLLIVGPEGGITPAELEAFVAAGARAVRLGSGVLRSSTAGPAALAVLSAARRWR